MAITSNKQLSTEQQTELLQILKSRFDKNIKRHQNIDWNTVEEKLIANPQKLWSLNEMEKTGGGNITGCRAGTCDLGWLYSI